MEATPISKLANKIKTLSFSEGTFDGDKFYEKYKGAPFLKTRQNIFKILGRSSELVKALDAMDPGEMLTIEDMLVETDVPLLIKKSTCFDDSDVDSEDFTFRRLSGLVAAHVYKNESQFPNIYASEPEALGLTYSNKNRTQMRVYLSAVPGAEHFQTFDYYPFLCALRSFRLKRISEANLRKIANIRCSSEEPMAVRCERNFDNAEKISTHFGNFGEEFNLLKVIKTTPPDIKYYFRILLHKSQ